MRSSDADIIRLEGISGASFDYVQKNLINAFYHIEIPLNDGSSVFYLFRSDNVRVDTRISGTEDSSIYLADTEVISSGLKFTISELCAGKDAFKLGEKMYNADIGRLIVFDGQSSYGNDFIIGSKILKKFQNDDFKINVFINTECVVLKEVECLKNDVFETSMFDFAFFHK